ncbi:hypothetical protein [Nocardia sp. NPDC023988]|uniref:hypothetical protein n=1 Tax=unclassified Nocardia TaxID=2637762 RepID=UPI0033DCCF93
MGTELRGIQNREATPAAIEELAAQHNLGALREVFGPYQRWVFTRLNNARLYVYEDGLAFTGDHPPTAFAWRSTSVWNYNRSINGGLTDSRWVLVGDDRRAFAIGRGAHVTTPRLEGRRVTDIQRGAPFVFEGVWGPEVQAGIARTQLPDAWSDLQRGKTLDFHKIAISATELHVGSKSRAWSDLVKATAADGMLWCYTRSRKSIPLIGLDEIRNLGLVMTLIKLLAEHHKPS